MALDWEFIQNVQMKELNDAQAEILYDQLIQYNVNGSESIEQLKKLFDCSKLVMQVKAIQADDAIEELEEIISRETSNQKAIKSNLDKNDLVEENEQQLLELERANELLSTQLREKDAELNRSEQAKSNLEQTLKSTEKQLQNYRQEIEQLREELNEKEQITEHLADNNLSFEQLKDMNKKFYILLGEMKDMETMNRQLGEKVMKLNQELDSATYQMQTATNEMQYMKNNLNNLQEMNEILINEKEEHLNEIKKLKTLTNNYELESGEHLDSSSKTIQDLLENLKQKEEELNDLRSQFDSMDRKQIEGEKAYFVREISKRDNHIKLLTNQLSQANDDIEAHIRMIENLIEKSFKNIHKSESSDGSTTRNDLEQVLNSTQLINKLEEELKSKDAEMTLLHQRNTLYEQGIYGLSEAVEEINKLSKLNKSKDNEIDNLIKELNSINLKLSNTQDELDYLKEFMNADDDLKQKLNEESKVKNDKLKILKLQKEVIRLDGEKLKLYEELLSLKMDRSTIKKLEDHHQSISEFSQNDEDMKQLQKLNSLQELENENRELQLAMKEILINLKKSDSKSDVVIDCPSLERLCQFHESRSINVNLANVIELKAELDLLRGQNEELRMTNKRLNNDILKIFKNYSKQLMTDFENKHRSMNHFNELNKESNSNGIDQNNQTLTEDEFYDSDLSEGEIVLNSRSISRKQDQQTQTDLDLNGSEHDSTSDSSSDKRSSSTVNPLYENQLNDQNENQLNDQNENQLNDQNKNQLTNQDVNQLTNQDVNQSNNESKDHYPATASSSTDTDEQNTFTIQKSFNDLAIQTEICLDDLKNINFLKEINELNLSIDDLKDLINQKDLFDQKDSIDKNLIKTVSKKNASSQTIETVLETADQKTASAKCSECSLVQNLLIEFQNKIDHDSNLIQREDLYTEKIKELQEENKRLQNELQKIVQIKDDLLNQKDKQIIELNDKLVDQKERIISLEENLKKSTEKMKLDLKEKSKTDSLEQNSQIDDQSKLDKQSIDSQLAIVNKANFDSTNQKSLISILETIIKCLQARIEHKDEAIAHCQQLLNKTQEEHQQEIQKLIKNYKKTSEHSILKAIQSSSNVNQEQLESTLAKYNDQLNEFKTYHQKVLAEQKKAFELQSGKMKRLKTENERLKTQANSIEELNRLRTENEQLNKLVEKNVKYVEKLKNAIKEERELKQDIKNELKQDKQEETGRSMQINKLKEEIENLYKLLISKDKQIKELQLSKWNLEKKIGEIIQISKSELKVKAEELEKMRIDQAKLKSLLEKLEKERSAQRRKQAIVIRESKNEMNKEVQTDKMVSFETVHDNSIFIDKFRELDQTISTLKSQLQIYADREKELISMLETKGFKSTNNRPKKETFSIQTIKEYRPPESSICSFTAHSEIL